MHTDSINATSHQFPIQPLMQVLESVRSIKAKLNRVVGRVERVKTELAEILDDDHGTCWLVVTACGFEVDKKLH